MTTAVQPGGGGELDRPSGSGLADVIDTILDKGLVIDAYVRVSLVGIEVLTIDARIVVASVETYLQFAEAVNRLDLTETKEKGLPEMMKGLQEGGAESKTKGVLDAAGDKLREFADSDDSDEEERRPSRRRRREES
ncbi:MAG TPA: gas vesicle protein GvpJ [Streptosporangiaceae bacterium]|nr:gas vesicle protein GvpJ [Streptosporangiaceae bacterium]